MAVNYCDHLSEEMLKDCDTVYLEGIGNEVGEYVTPNMVIVVLKQIYKIICYNMLYNIILEFNIKTLN